MTVTVTLPLPVVEALLQAAINADDDAIVAARQAVEDAKLAVAPYVSDGSRNDNYRKLVLDCVAAHAKAVEDGLGHYDDEYRERVKPHVDAVILGAIEFDEPPQEIMHPLLDRVETTLDHEGDELGPIGVRYIIERGVRSDALFTPHWLTFVAKFKECLRP
jgi:hypothetical protein